MQNCYLEVNENSCEEFSFSVERALTPQFCRITDKIEGKVSDRRFLRFNRVQRREIPRPLRHVARSGRKSVFESCARELSRERSRERNMSVFFIDLLSVFRYFVTPIRWSIRSFPQLSAAHLTHLAK